MQSVVDRGHPTVLGGLQLEAEKTAIVIHGHVGEHYTLAPFTTDKNAVGAPEKECK